VLEISGAAGIGKTALLEAAVRDTGSAGALVPAATGSELERDSWQADLVG
jgi:Ni2+-binding GTPase involved in maturation of urease and hydrogenase